MSRLKGRFAPSPSGRMHLGNVWCALLAWLSVKSRGGTMVLRIEDLDPARCRAEYMIQLMEDLRWLGLLWDEGPEAAQPAAPYVQSACKLLYEQALQSLVQRAQVYECFCTRAQLHAASAPHADDGTPIYTGCCRTLSAQARADRLAAGRVPALRIAVPARSTVFCDGHMGAYRQVLATECGDFILRRSDGVFAYQLAVVVDDARMGVTEVVRGQDLLSCTPRQIYLHRLLDLPVPAYYHIPLLVNEQGRRLSKREHSLHMQTLRDRFAPEELLGWLGYMAGLLPRVRSVTLNELLAAFSWQAVPTQPVTVPMQLMGQKEGGGFV